MAEEEVAGAGAKEGAVVEEAGAAAEEEEVAADPEAPEGLRRLQRIKSFRSGRPSWG